MSVITIAHSAVTAKLVGPTKEQKLEVQQLLSYKIDGFDRVNFGSGHWDGRSSLFNFADASFPAGFVPLVQAAFKRKGATVNVLRKPFPAPLGPLNPRVDAFPEDPRYDYQPGVVEALLRYGKMIAQVATGGGKSRIAKLTHARIGRPTLFLTTRSILMHQMRNAFVEDMGVPVAVYGDDQWSPAPTAFSVGMVQTFAARLAETSPDKELEALAIARERKVDKAISPFKAAWKKEGKTGPALDVLVAQQREAFMKLQKSDEALIEEAKARAATAAKLRAETIELLKTFELVIGEEAHEVSSDSFFTIMSHCTNAHYRLALTATPFMKDSEEANMRLMACFGPVGVRVSEKDLIDRGILAKPYFKFRRSVNPNPVGRVPDGRYTPPREIEARLSRTMEYQRAYEVGVSCGVERNRMICEEVAQAKAHGLSSMVLVQHKIHGQRLAELMTAQGTRCAFIMGEHSQVERSAAISALKTGQIDCLIGSTILDVGVDVPAVGLVVLAGAGKAEVATRQRIGRGLRAKKSGPNVCFVIDFDDWQNNHLGSHSRERRGMIESTPGFVEGITDHLPYELFKSAA